MVAFVFKLNFLSSWYRSTMRSRRLPLPQPAGTCAVSAVGRDVGASAAGRDIGASVEASSERDKACSPVKMRLRSLEWRAHHFATPPTESLARAIILDTIV